MNNKKFLGGIFSGIFDNWKYDFHNNKPLFWLEFFGTVMCIITAAVLAFTARKPDMILIYSMYLSGSSSLAIVGYLRSNGFFVMVNVCFLVVDIIGLINMLTA